MDQNSVVLISGCSSGIGLALAREFASRGCRVFATARKPEVIENLRQEGMETAASMADRLYELIEEIKLKHKNETIVFVSHGYLIKVLLSILHGWPVEEFYKVKLMGNSAYSTVELA